MPPIANSDALLRSLDVLPNADLSDEPGWRRLELSLPAEACAALQAVLQSDVSAEEVLSVAWAALIARTTGLSDVALGVEPVNAQPAAPADPVTIIGIAAKVKNEETPAQLGQQIQSSIAQVRQQRQAAGIRSSTAPASLAVLVTQSLTRHHAAWPTDWLVSSLKRDHAASFHLELHVHATHLDDLLAKRLLADASSALSAIIKAPDQPIGQQTIVDLAPMQRLNEQGAIERWQYDGPGNLSAAFTRRVTATPDATALCFSRVGSDPATAEHWTFQMLDAAANQWAGTLAARGIEHGDVVGLATPRGPVSIAIMIACVKIGACYLPLEASFPAQRLRFMLAHARASIVVCAPEHTALFSDEVETYPIDTSSHDGLHAFSQGEPITPFTADSAVELLPETPAYIMFTSGSTGKPKGVAISHQAILRLVGAPDFMQLDQSTRMLHMAPLGFDASTLEIWGPLLNGGSCAIYTAPLPTGFDIAATVSALGANAAWITAALFNRIIDADPHHLAGLKQILTGGEALSVPHIQRAQQSLPNTAFINGYGPTESTTFTCTWPIESLPPNATQVPIGKPVSATWLAIVNPLGQAVPAGVTGELLTGGLGLASGYLNSPDQTRRSFVKNPFKDGPRQLYRTGDLVRLNRAGVLEFVGRLDDQIKIRGYRVEPREIENVLTALPGVEQACLLTEQDASKTTRFIACVATTSKQSATELAEQLAQTLPDYMLPVAYLMLNALPVNANGKVDRAALRALRSQAEEPTVKTSAVANTPEATDAADPTDTNASIQSNRGPETVSREDSESLELVIARVMAEVLGHERFEQHQHFFNEGGNSLLAIAALDTLRTSHGINCPVGDFYSYPTPAGLAAALQPNKSVGSDSVETATAIAHESTDRAGDDAVAIIGLQVRLPGANSVDQYWHNLIEGVDSIRQFTALELDASLPPSLRDDPNYVAARGVIDGADQFDAEFFGISPREAELLDPQQRVFLELCWSCLEDAGYVPDQASTPNNPVGVFGGMYNASYRQNNLAAHPDKVAQLGEFLVMLGNEKDYIATRTAHRLNLTGPAISVHTACSTSLVAVVQAAESLLAGQCTMALAGGVSITCPPASGHLFQEGAMMSPDGSTRTFDADAAGTVFSDGAAVVLLKPLSLAKRDGDTIHAVIRAGAVNNDGGGKASFMAPSAAGQAQVIQQALSRAKLSPADISYVEAHGTATPSGDPIEVDGLKQVFASAGNTRTLPDAPWCSLGSVKSNIGHTVTAAGVAGLIKTVLALKHEVIPPTLHFSSLNPAINLDGSPFRIADQAQPWPRSDTQPRRAGVSAFGVGGTNAHVIIEEAPDQEKPSEQQRSDSSESQASRQVLRVSAATQPALQRALTQLAERLEAQQAGIAATTGDAAFLKNVAHTLHVARKPMAWRATVSGTTISEVLTKLRAPVRAVEARLTGAQIPVVFVFPGQGAQYVQMGSALMQANAVFADAFQRAIDTVSPHVAGNFADLLLSGADEKVLAQTANLQPALFCLEFALGETLIAAGFEPAAMIGHSIGEFAAASLAGVMSLDTAAKLVSRRGALMQAQPSGAMLSVLMPAKALADILPSGLDLAAENGPEAAVCAGPSDAIDAFTESLKAQGLTCRLLNTSHAFHSAMMAPAAEQFAREVSNEVSQVGLHAPQRPIVSTKTGQLLTAEQACDPAYWAEQLRSPVRFAPAVRTALANHPDAAFLELGPRASLSALVRLISEGKSHAIASLGDQADKEAESFADCFGQLWCAGFDTRAALPTQGQRIPLPTYPFEPSRHWLEAAAWSGNGQAQQTTMPMASPAAESPTPDSAPVSIHDRLRDLLEQASGLSFEPAHDEVSFAELGLDSLSLTQIALQVKRAFKADVSFRQLMQEHDSINRLADYLNNQAPVSEPAATAPSGTTTTRQPAASNRADSKPGVTPSPLSPPAKAFGAIARIQTSQTELTDDQRERVASLVNRYAQRTAASKAYAQNNRRQMADPRVVNGFKPILKEITYPIVTERSAGAYLWDLDGNRYVDALNGFGMNLFGWQPKFVTDAITEALATGYEIGPQHPLAGSVAAGICEMTGADRAALCNTGSEAVMGATRMARTVTGRPKVVVFDGAYHGIFDEVIVRGARGHRAIPAAPGIMPNTAENVISLPYGLPESLDVIRDNADDIAAVLVEPVQSRRPDFQPKEFLAELRTITEQTGIVLVFDEVVTGFRTHPAGIQAVFDIKADVTTYGKVIGGGFPIGIIAGKQAFMDSLDGGFWQFGDASVPEVGVTYFAGTFVRHPLALAAADAVLKHLKASGPALQSDLNARTTAFASELNAFAQSVGAPVEVRHFSSFWKITFTADHMLQELLFPMMREQGVHILDGFPSFMTTAHQDADIDIIKNAFMTAVKDLQRGRFLPARGVKPGVLFDAKRPPVPGARLGRDRDGKPAWFIPNPDAPGKYLRIKDHV